MKVNRLHLIITGALWLSLGAISLYNKQDSMFGNSAMVVGAICINLGLALTNANEKENQE